MGTSVDHCARAPHERQQAKGRPPPDRNLPLDSGGIGTNLHVSPMNTFNSSAQDLRSPKSGVGGTGAKGVVPFVAKPQRYAAAPSRSSSLSRPPVTELSYKPEFGHVHRFRLLITHRADGSME